MKTEKTIEQKRYYRSETLDEAIRLVKPYRGRDKLYGFTATNERGNITEVGVYNGNTKKYAIYRADEVDANAVAEFKKILSA